MNNLDLSTDGIKQHVTTQFESFRANTSIHPMDILDWLSTNLNSLSDTLTGGKSHELMENSSSWYTSVRTIDDKPVLVFQTAWLYKTEASASAQPPKLEVLTELLPGVTVVPLGNTKEEVAADLFFDAAHWNNLVPHVLYFKASNALTGPSNMLEGRESDLREALTLAKYFYPHITRELLFIGKDIGMLESIETFKAWCPSGATSSNMTSELPRDL